MSSKGEKDYAVGKGKPPASGRWKKGQSGNPAGRKRGEKMKTEPALLGDMLADAMCRKISVTMANRTKNIEIGEAISEKILRGFLAADNALEQKYYVDMFTKLGVWAKLEKLKEAYNRNVHSNPYDESDRRLLERLMNYDPKDFDSLFGDEDNSLEPGDSPEEDAGEPEPIDWENDPFWKDTIITLEDDPDDPSTDGAISSDAGDSVD